MTKYPFDRLAIEQTEAVPDVPNTNAARVALKQWRDAVLRDGLGTRDCCPQFHIAYDAERGTATITRLPDGPMRRGRHKASAVAQAMSPQARERAALWAFLERHEQAVERASRAGEPWPMTPLDVMTRAVACDPFIAQRLADLDCGPRRAGDLGHLDDELLAEQILAQPHNTRPLRRHDDRPDLPQDRRLCARLTRT